MTGLLISSLEPLALPEESLALLTVPDGPVKYTATREWAADLAARLCGLDMQLGGVTAPDGNLVAPDCRPGVRAAVDAGLLPLIGADFRPLDGFSQEDADAFVLAVAGYLASLETIPAPTSPPARTAGVSSVPILMYHAVTTDASLPAKNSLYVTIGALEKQLADIVKNGYTPVFASELGGPLPEKPIIVTFDDGYRNNYELAFPLLKKYNVRATIFLIASAPDYANSSFVSWDMAREMAASGLVEFQSHTYDEHYRELSRMTGESAVALEKRLQKDWDNIKDAFARELGTTPTVLCYPSGHYDADTLKLVPKWYKFAVTTKNGIGKPGSSPFELSRYRITQGSAIPKSYGS